MLLEVAVEVFSNICSFMWDLLAKQLNYPESAPKALRVPVAMAMNIFSSVSSHGSHRLHLINTVAYFYFQVRILEKTDLYRYPQNAALIYHWDPKL